MTTSDGATADGSRCRVVVVSRQRALAEALALLLEVRFDQSARGVGDDDLATAADGLDPDVLVVDTTPASTATVQAAAARWPAVPVVLLVPDATADLSNVLASTGAVGCVCRRTSSPEDLAGAVRSAFGAAAAVPIGASGHREDGTELTPREVAVLELVATGAPNDAIAAHMGISPNTVRTHVQNIMAKLGVHSRLEAVARGHERRVVR